MDGRHPRNVKVCIRFGAELDSLSDLVVFGVCPAVVLYLFSLSSVDRIGWVVCAFFAICMALRLARFNVSDIENISTDLTQRGFSVGVPAPAGAILNLFPIVLYNAFKTDFFKNPYFGIVISIATSLLCVSKIPTFTIKKLHIKRENYMVFLLYMIVFVCTVFVYTWKMFSVCILAYVASMFVSNSKAKILSDKSNE
jgi:CDP-diacylglycerol--serine O-phosphatidyltransferase